MLNGTTNVMKSLCDDIQSRVLGQQHMARAMTLALMTGEHVAVIGPPGEGKTMMATMVARDYVKGWSSYYHLLTRYTTPDEVLGHFSIAKLQQDIYERRTAGKAPDAEVVILDEVFKANSPMLNALLGLLNERMVDGIKCKLQTLLGCSNEYPKAGYGDDAVDALWDRFLFRIEIGRASSNDVRDLMIGGAQRPMGMTCLTGDQVNAVQVKVYDLASRIPIAVIDAVMKLQAELKINGVDISTRRMVKSKLVLAASAVLRGNKEVSHRDLQSLSMVFWDKPKDREILAKALMQVASPVANLIMTIQMMLNQKLDNVNGSRGVEQTAAKYDCLKWIKSQGMQLKDVATTDNDDLREINSIKNDLRKTHSRLMRELADDEVEF